MKQFIPILPVLLGVSVSFQALAAVKQMSPSGEISTQPTFQWEAKPDSKSYTIGIENPYGSGDDWQEYNVSSADAGCAGANTICSYNLPRKFQNNEAINWFVKPSGDNWSDGLIFTVKTTDENNSPINEVTDPVNNEEVTFYVAPSGSDGGDGSQNNPFKTINHAIEQLSNSKPTTLHIKAGVYKELVVISNVNNLTIQGERSKDGEALSIIDGSNSPDPLDEGNYHTGQLTAKNMKKFTIDSLKVRNTKGHGFVIKDSGTDITIKNSESNNTQGSGILIGFLGKEFHGYKFKNVNVLNNRVIAPQEGRWSGHNLWEEDISLSGGVDGFVISGNYVDAISSYKLGRVDGGPIGIDVKNGIKNGEIHHNTIINIPSGGIYIDSYKAGALNINVYQNFIKNVAKAGIQISGEGGGAVFNTKVYHNIVVNGEAGLACDNNSTVANTTQSEKHVDFFNNTIFNTEMGMWISEDLCQGKIYNNVISTTKNYDISFWGNIGERITIDNNCFHNINKDNEPGNNPVYDDNTESLFVNENQEDYRIKNTSSCSGKGVPNEVSVGTGHSHQSSHTDAAPEDETDNTNSGLTIPTSIAPQGGTTNTSPTYQWKAAVNATAYTIGIGTENSEDESAWREYDVTSDEANCTAGQICSYTPEEGLSFGDNVIWWIKASNANEETDYADQGMKFQLTHAVRHTNSHAKIFIIGDSTVHNTDEGELGWGSSLQNYLVNSENVFNKARAGTSSKSFKVEQNWTDHDWADTKQLMTETDISAGAYLLIQFGHNDQANDVELYTAPGRGNSFYTNLEEYIDEAQAMGVIPVLITPVEGMTKNSGEDSMHFHSEYAQTIRDLAADRNVLLLDLQQKSWNEFNNYDDSQELQNVFGHDDEVHFSPKGANSVAGWVKDLICEADQLLCEQFR